MNIELLCRCKADAQVDATLRREACQAASLQIVDSDPDHDNGEDGGLHDVDEAIESNDQCVDLEYPASSFHYRQR